MDEISGQGCPDHQVVKLGRPKLKKTELHIGKIYSTRNIHVVSMNANAVNAIGKTWCMRVQRALKEKGRLPLTNFVLGMLATMLLIWRGRKLGRNIRCPFRATQGPNPS